MLPYDSADVSGFMDESTFIYHSYPANHYNYYPEKNLVVQAGELNDLHMKNTFSEKKEQLIKQHRHIIDRKNKKVKINKSGAL